MIDANQNWDVDEAIARVNELAHFKLWWIEEPTQPGRRARARGDCERRSGRPASASRRASTAPTASSSSSCCRRSAIDFCQIDSCRLGGVNENLAVILMAAKFGVPVCPHAGGVGLCEYVQHLSMFDYLAVTGTMEGRVIEFVDHLHEHFEDAGRRSATPATWRRRSRATASRSSRTRATSIDSLTESFGLRFARVNSQAPTPNFQGSSRLPTDNRSISSLFAICEFDCLGSWELAVGS